MPPEHASPPASRGAAHVLVASPHPPPADTLAATDRLLSRLVDELASTVAGVLDEGVLGDVALDGTLDDGPTEALGPDRSPLDWDLVGELDLALRRRGKRIRPTVAHWGWVAAGGPARPGTQGVLTRVCAALDLLHLFALVQDDVMDRSATRRGAPTLHRVAAERHTRAGGLGDPALFGDSVAMLLSDLALSEATLLLADAPAPLREAWRRMAVELVQGQLLDVTHTAMRRRDPRGAWAVARLKSGRYTVTRPLQLGAISAGTDARTLDRLGRWGDLVGEAFALRDDLLGVWGNPGVTGKPAGDDLLVGKPTVLLAWAAEMLPPEAHPLLERCDRSELDPAGVAALQTAMVEAGVRERADETLVSLLAEADRALDAIGLPPAARRGLAGLADQVAWRAA